jgi:hypothetical protein
VIDSNGNLKNADAMMEEVADKFAGMEDGAGKSALAMMIFGKAGAGMIPMLNGGAEGLRKARAEAKALGLTLTEDTGKAAEQFNDNLTRMAYVGRGLGKAVMEEVLPSLTSFSDELFNTAKETNALKTAAEAAGFMLRTFLTGIVAVGAGVQVAGDSIAKLARAFQLLAMDPAEAMVSPYAAMVTAIQRGGPEVVKLLTEDSADMASVIENAVNMINGIWDTAGAKAKQSAADAEEASGRHARATAPIIANEKAIAEARKAQEAATKAAAKAEQEFQDLMAKQAMKRIQMQDEAEKKATEEAEQKRAKMITDIEALKESLLSEEEAQREAHTRKLALLIEANENYLITDGEMMAIREEMERQHQEKLAQIKKRSMTDLEKFNKKSWQEQTQTILSEFTALTAGAAQQSRTLFNINKAAGIATAIMNAYIGISRTLGAYPFPWNIAMAAAHGVAAFAQVQSIRSQQFNGGGAGSAPSLAGSTAAAPVTPVTSGAPAVLGNQSQQRAPMQVIVNVQGRSITRDQLEEIFDGLNELNEDGMPVRFTMAAQS